MRHIYFACNPKYCFLNRVIGVDPSMQSDAPIPIGYARNIMSVMPVIPNQIIMYNSLRISTLLLFCAPDDYVHCAHYHPNHYSHTSHCHSSSLGIYSPHSMHYIMAMYLCTNKTNGYHNRIPIAV